MKQFIDLLERFLVMISIICIRIYQFTISPDKGLLRYFLHGRVCAHDPHCSAYAVSCLQRYGLLTGWSMALRRVYHCRPAQQSTYDPPYLRVVFFSSAAIGIPFLEGLLNDPRYEVVAVVTVPEQPVGRGMHLQKNIIAQRLEQHGKAIPVYTPRTLRTEHTKRGDDALYVTQQLQNLHPDIYVVVAYGKLLPASLLALPRMGPINVHGSLLPAYRGATPLQSVFLDQLETSGLTIMLMDEGLDTGPILAQVTIPLLFDWTVQDLIDACKLQGPSLLLETVWQWKQNKITPTPQPAIPTSVCHKLTKEDGLIDPQTLSLRETYARRKAFSMWPKVYFFVGDKRVTVEHIVLDQTTFPVMSALPFLTATYQLNPAISSCKVTPAGKRSMDREDFIRGVQQKSS